MNKLCKSTKFCFIFLLTLILCSCASSQLPSMSAEQASSQVQKSPDKTKTQAIKETKANDIHHWRLKGALGVRDGNEAWSASIAWQQSGRSYNVRLYGPVGIGTVIIDGRPGSAKLTNSKNETFTASNGEELLKQQTGLYLPVSNLYYWARGLPVPNVPAKKSYDQFDNITAMRQQGWLIQYQRYSRVKGIQLPRKITMSNQRLRIKLVINSWTI